MAVTVEVKAVYYSENWAACQLDACKHYLGQRISQIIASLTNRLYVTHSVNVLKRHIKVVLSRTSTSREHCCPLQLALAVNGKRRFALLGLEQCTEREEFQNSDATPG